MSCLLWEDSFYENGESIANRIASLVPKVDVEKVSAMAVDSRERMKLRHAPLLVVREMARHASHRGLVAKTLSSVIQRADELSEFLAIYWKDGRCKVSAQVKKGLALAFQKFNSYQLAKYNRDGSVKLRDALFICHAKPKDAEQAGVWKQLADGTLPVPDTWEVSLSAGKNKKETWERLLSEKKLGGLALLRNLRNMEESGVPHATVRYALANMNTDRILPFRFLSASVHAPKMERDLEAAMFRSVSQEKKLPGKTVVIVDVSGSMYHYTISAKSTINRAKAACSLAAIAREVCEEPVIFATGGNDRLFKHATQEVPARRGIALVDAIYGLCSPLGGGGIFLNQVCEFVREKEKDADRTIVITDEQDCSSGSADAPDKAVPLGLGYMLNVNTCKNGIGYKPHWTHIDGWSESVLDYIIESER